MVNTYLDDQRMLISHRRIAFYVPCLALPSDRVSKSLAVLVVQVGLADLPLEYIHRHCLALADPVDRVHHFAHPYRGLPYRP